MGTASPNPHPLLPSTPQVWSGWHSIHTTGIPSTDDTSKKKKRLWDKKKLDPGLGNFGQMEHSPIFWFQNFVFLNIMSQECWFNNLHQSLSWNQLWHAFCVWDDANFKLKYRSVICCCTFGTLGQYLEGNICTSGELGHFQNYWICFKDESCQAVGSERGVLEGFNEDMRKTPMSMMIIINIIIVITIIIIMLGDSGNPLPWFPRIWGGGLDLLHRGKTIPTPPQCAQWVK